MACSGDSQNGLGGTRGHWGTLGSMGSTGGDTQGGGAPRVAGVPQDGGASKMEISQVPRVSWGLSVPKTGASWDRGDTGNEGAQTTGGVSGNCGHPWGLCPRDRELSEGLGGEVWGDFGDPSHHRPPQLSASTATMRSTEPSTARWISTGRTGPPPGLGGKGGQGG